MSLPYYSAELRERDRNAQGRKLLIVVVAAFFVAWIFNFMASPVSLVPGFFYDRSGETAERLFGLLIQYGLFSTFVILVLAGFGWVRYVFAVYLLLAGMSNVMLSIMMDAYGGAQLVLGSIYLASAAVLTLSVSIVKYLEFRRGQGVPWLALIVSLPILCTVPVALGAFEWAHAWSAWQAALVQDAKEAEIFKKFAPELDINALLDVSSEHLRQELSEPGTRDEFVNLRKKFGDFHSVDIPPAPTLESTVLHPRTRTAWASDTIAHYSQANAFITFEEEVVAGNVTITRFQVQEVDKPKSR